MGKSAATALLAAVVLAGCATPPPPPVVTLVKGKQDFPPKPLTLLYTTFQDHAVIQRDKPIPVWGLATPGAHVDVSLAGATASATADDKGAWKATLPAMPAGGPYMLAAKTDSGQSQSVSDVMAGDVYLCSGQSNMEMPLRLATNYDSELRAANNSLLRLFHVQRFSSASPRQTFGADAGWSVTTPETAKEFSATCYYFGNNLQPAAGVAVGLIEDAWGGSAIKAWIGTDKLAKLGGYDEAIAINKTYAVSPKEGEAQWRAAVLSWWTKHDPALSGKPSVIAPAFDDTAWAEAVPTGTWRAWDVPALKTFDGIVWLRKTIEVTAAQAQGGAILSLGPIDSYDIAWINGSFVGAGEGYDVNRVYEIPAGVLHEGKNVLALGVQAGAGILSPGAKMNLKFADGSTTALSGSWRWKTSASLQQTGSPMDAPWLNQFGTATLYNGMLLPLGPTQIRGVVWYQGESDTSHPKEYARLLPAMIEDWREKFGSDTPFFITQLPGFGAATTKSEPSNWASLREVQREVVNATPNAALAVTTDLGLRDIIHPGAKQEVGRRLALLAEKMVYGKNILAFSPSPTTVTRKGSRITVAFEHVGQGLAAYEWDRAIGFQLCDAAGQCRFVDGALGRDKVEIDAAQFPKATRVRFCWADSPICNLYNSEGLPAVPFEKEISRSRTGS